MRSGVTEWRARTLAASAPLLLLQRLRLPLRLPLRLHHGPCLCLYLSLLAMLLAAAEAGRRRTWAAALRLQKEERAFIGGFGEQRRKKAEPSGQGAQASSELWPLERPEGMPAIQSLEVMCGKDHMDVHLSFTQPFEGIVSSKGQYADPRCVYVPPSTGKTFFSFRIAYERCGTKPDLHGQFYENTVVVQYDKDLLEVWDEAKRLRCEWFNDYEKTASKPPMVIADLDVIQLDFRGDNVDCWMEIQHGKGPWAPPVSGIVPLGSTLTLVVAINDYRGEFDMRVKSCVASDGGGHVIQLSDEHGCVLRPKMISRFLKARTADERATVITYAFFHAFKFPDALSVHIKCKVEICRHGCPEHCQHGPAERRDTAVPAPSAPPELLLYDELVSDGTPAFADEPAVHMAGNKGATIPRQPFQEQPRPGHRDGQERFPHGPRTLRSTGFARPRRSVAVPAGGNADVGVSGLYDVVSEADLAFTPDSRPEAVTVFQGRTREEEVVYGVCLPVPGFGALFALAALSAVAAALVAGALLYRYQVRRETAAAAAAAATQTSGNNTGGRSIGRQANGVPLDALGPQPQAHAHVQRAHRSSGQSETSG